MLVYKNKFNEVPPGKGYDVNTIISIFAIG